MKILSRVWLSLAVLSLLGQTARADSFNYSNGAGLTSKYARSMIETVGYGAVHRSLSSASPLGVFIGLDVGVTVSAFSLPDDFKDAMTAVGNNKSVPALMLLPKLVVTKGLPLGIDVTGSWVGYDGNSVLGLEGKWAFLRDKAALPTVAAVVSYTSSTIAFLKATNWKVDVLASKKFLVIDPYLGFGMEFVSGSVEIPKSQQSPGVASTASAKSMHFYVGLPITLTVLRLAAEYDTTLAGFHSVSAKFALSF